jgi:hypothetical protein
VAGAGGAESARLSAGGSRQQANQVPPDRIRWLRIKLRHLEVVDPTLIG